MKTVIAYILPALLALAVLSYCVDGLADGIDLTMREVVRVLVGAK